jgi:AcrR family transcriptional regulator
MVRGDFQRARRPHQKEQRRAAIVEAARQLLAQDAVDRVTLTAIADRVGLAKSNVYRYFEGREQILLTILLGDVVAWAGEVVGGLHELEDRDGAATVARVITAAFAARPRLCELISVGGRVLEPKVSGPAVLEFRTAADAATLAVAGGLHRVLPAVPRDHCEWAIKTIFAVVAGLWRRPRRSTAARAVGSGTEAARGWFAGDLERSVRGLLYGLQVEAWRASGRPVGRS